MTDIKAEELQSLITSNYKLVVRQVSELKKNNYPGRKRRPPAIIRRFLNIKKKSLRKLKRYKLTDKSACTN